MGLVREPKGVDFSVNSRPLEDWEKKQISEIISHHKKTGRIKNESIPKKTKKEQVV